MRAASHQRILLFQGANEAGGTAYLYRILQTTKHPLFIYYLSRFRPEGQSAAQFILRDPDFNKALKESGSALKYEQLPTVTGSVRKAANVVMERLKRRYQNSHGERPLSYIFLNGHPSYGYQPKSEEKADLREKRLTKYWAPWEGALNQVIPANEYDKYEYQAPCVTTKIFVSHMSTLLSLILPLLRDDGEGTVVLKTPSFGSLDLVRSKEMRQSLLNPSPRFYESSALSLRLAIDKVLNNEILHDYPWPPLSRFLGLGDVYAKSAITLYKSYTPFQSIIFNRCVHDPMDIDEPVKLLLDENRANFQHDQFSEQEQAFAKEDFLDDVDRVEMLQNSSGIVRRVVNVRSSFGTLQADMVAPKNFSPEVFSRKYPDPNSPNTPLIRPIYTAENLQEEFTNFSPNFAINPQGFKINLRPVKSGR
ncbi:hypothetical protein ABW20_dc0100753 [Dactylellina cionopaga]|nr:hypothetical protein ABW20_dc0100753 [Dactylellina cionopaga]